MYSKALLLSAFSAVFATVVPSSEIFSQSGCVASHTGPLRHHHFESYHYDPKTTQCEKSIFGDCDDGCQGFRTEEDCRNECAKFTINPIDPTGMPSFSQSQCKVSKPKTMKKKFEDVPARCFVKTETGKCRMGVESYHFDIATEKCIKSTFDGCNDGCLAFKTFEECQSTCDRFFIDV
ncbi:hypothetical protein K502DRAFT_359626 [Neoconidiobolus thromboides FSU 785]|nr:hypothetical protein K502DRAFT_359626 [Neoconidiobolus thromboides FSU 785]